MAAPPFVSMAPPLTPFPDEYAQVASFPASVPSIQRATGVSFAVEEREGLLYEVACVRLETVRMSLSRSFRPSGRVLTLSMAGAGEMPHVMVRAVVRSVLDQLSLSERDIVWFHQGLAGEMPMLPDAVPRTLAAAGSAPQSSSAEFFETMTDFLGDSPLEQDQRVRP